MADYEGPCYQAQDQSVAETGSDGMNSGLLHSSLSPENTSLWKMTRRIMRIGDPNPPLQAPGGSAHSDLEKTKALASNLESQFQPVPIPPAQAPDAETVREFMQSFSLAPTSEPQLTTLAEVSKTIRELKVVKAPGPNGVPNRP